MVDTLIPDLIAFHHQLEKGSLIRNVTQKDAKNGDGRKGFEADILTFQYNPETITRTRTGKWEPRKRRRRDIPTPQEVRGERGGQGSAALLAESETISMKIVFDATEAILAGQGYAGRAEGGQPPSPETPVAAKGILPQLAFLDLVSLGREEDESRKGAKREASRPVRPDEMLLVLGPERMFPVVMTSLTITEQKFNPSLVPIRAEVDIKMNVLEPVESAYNRWVKNAFDELLRRRIEASQLLTHRDDVPSFIANALQPRQS
jgi:hypothetical protein